MDAPVDAPILDAAKAAPEAGVMPPPTAKGWLRLSPINQRRLANFKAHQRGLWSFWIFIVLFVLSLCAEFIANDRPILVVYKGEVLIPILHDYPEEKFGGFLARTDYRDAVIADEIKAHGFMVWPPVHFSYRTINLAIADARALAADLDAEQGAMRARPPSASARPTRMAAAATSNGTGSAPTIRAATCWRGSFTASGSRFCSASRWPASPR